MAVQCLTSTRFNMQAEVWHWTGVSEGTPDDVTPGHWEVYQDPITGEIKNIWKPDENTDTPPKAITIPCQARGIVDGGIRVAGATETFGAKYYNTEYVRLIVPGWVSINKSDRVTNIMDSNSNIVFLDEESDGGSTMFNVNGVQPMFDAFNRHIENFVLLQKA